VISVGYKCLISGGYLEITPSPSSDYLKELNFTLDSKIVQIFNLPNTSSRTMAPGMTQPLTEMSTRNLPGSKRAAGA
jgi:hypothetical protein